MVDRKDKGNGDDDAVKWKTFLLSEDTLIYYNCNLSRTNSEVA